MNDSQKNGFGKLERWSKKLRVLLMLQSLLTAVSIFFGIFEIEQLSDFDQSLEYQDYIWRAYIIVGISLVLYMTLIVVFCFWLYRAASNIVQSPVKGFGYSPRWVVGWYFVPFANLFKPFLAMRKIWNASHGVKNNLNAGVHILTVWWAAWVISYIGTMITIGRDVALIVEATAFEMLIDWFFLSTIGGAASLVFYLVTIKLVQDITRAQGAWFDQSNAAEIFS